LNLFIRPLPFSLRASNIPTRNFRRGSRNRPEFSMQAFGTRIVRFSCIGYNEFAERGEALTTEVVKM
jgi:hypothetical protein